MRKHPSSGSSTHLLPQRGEGNTTESSIYLLVSLLAFLFFLVALVPDEKLIRLKLRLLEGGFLLALIIWGLIQTWRARIDVRLSWILAPMGLWLGFVFLRAALSDWTMASDEVRRVFLCGAALWTASQVMGEAQRRQWIWRGWSLGAVLASMYGILQFTGGLGPLQVPAMQRVMSTFGNPIFFGAYLILSVPLIWMLWRQAPSAAEKYIWLGGLGLALAALFLTGTRAAWIGFLASVVVLMVFGRTKSTRSRLFWLAGLAAVFLFLVGTRGIWLRDQGHFLIWRDTVKLWQVSPVFGVGPGQFYSRFAAAAGPELRSKWPEGRSIINYAHSEPLQVLAETGALGFVFWAAILVVFAWRFHAGYARDPSSETLAIGAAVAASLTQSFFSVDHRFGVTAGLFYFLLGGLPDSDVRTKTRPLSVWQKVLLGFLISAGGVGLAVKWAHPYLAQQRQAAKPDFFQERLVNAANDMASLEALVKEHPENPGLYEKLGFVYAKQMEQWSAQGQKVFDRAMADKAITAYTRALSLDPQRWGVCNNLGNIHYMLGHREDALAFWERSLAIKPDQLDARLNLAKVLFTAGHIDQSTAHFRKVLELDPGNDEATVYLKRMVE